MNQKVEPRPSSLVTPPRVAESPVAIECGLFRVIEVGNIYWGPDIARTRIVTEGLFLTARHVFEQLGYRRFEWKCNALNEPSRRAALRFGFTFEGVFRQHLVVRGANRDTAWYSILDSEWPRARQALEGWLDPSNFDAAGKQKRRLEDIRAGLPE